MAAFWKRKRDGDAAPPAKERPAVCVSAEKADDVNTRLTYDNANITAFAPRYNFVQILLDKQGHIYDLYALADYYVDADPIFRGIIKGVYTPFSVSEWRLAGTNERVKAKYEDYYTKIHLRDKMWAIFYQYYKYGQVYIYLMDDGSFQTLPPHRCRISNVMRQGEPVVEFNALQVAIDLGYQNYDVRRKWIQDETFAVRMKGYPPEVAEGLKKGAEWVQLNPERTFVLQEIKEDWLRYAIPMIAAALLPLRKKELIANYEGSTLNMMVHSFLHVKYGDPARGSDFLPNKEELGALNGLFKQAMSKNGTGIATTNVFADAAFVQPNINELFKTDLYRDVNSEILAAGGISGIIVSGMADQGSSFASAQVSMQTAALRIKQARDNFCELMNKINSRVNGDILPRSKDENIPVFTFPPVDLTGSGKLYESCLRLWQLGVLSTKTMMDIHGYDVTQETERRLAEDVTGITRTLMPRTEQNAILDQMVLKEAGAETPQAQQPAQTTQREEETGEKSGRPEMSFDERKSDPADGVTGGQPKPSNPEGAGDMKM